MGVEAALAQGDELVIAGLARSLLCWRPMNIQLVLSRDELTTIVFALRAISANAFAQRLDAILQKTKPE